MPGMIAMCGGCVQLEAHEAWREGVTGRGGEAGLPGGQARRMSMCCVCVWRGVTVIREGMRVVRNGALHGVARA